REQAGLRFLGLECLARTDIVFYIVDDGECAAHLTCGITIRKQCRAYPAHIARGALLVLVVASDRSSKSLLDRALHLRERGWREKILERLAQEVFGRDTDVPAIGLIGKPHP